MVVEAGIPEGSNPINQTAIFSGIYFPVVGGSLPASSTYGAPRSNDRTHKGTDLFASSGTSVVAAVGGTLRLVGDTGSLSGYRVSITDTNGNVHLYGHLDPKSAALWSGWVERKTTIRAGQLIGYVGSTGNASSDSPHVHYSINERMDSLMPIDAWQFLSSGQMSQAPYSGTGSGVTGESLNSASRVPEGMDVYKVGSQYFWVGSVDGGGGATSWLYFTSTSVPTGAKTTSISQSAWDDKVIRSQMLNAGDALELNEFAGKTWQGVVDKMLMQAGIYGTDAMGDQVVMNAIAAFIADPTMEPNEFEGLLRTSQWWASHTDRQREWNDSSPAQQDLDIVDEVSKLAGLWFTYVGQDLNLQAYDTDGDGKVSGAEIQAGNPDLYKWGRAIASGEYTQGGVVNGWMKDVARQDENSPWSRSIRDEEIARGKFDVDQDSWAREVVNLYDKWGLPITYEAALKTGKDLAMNATSYADVEELVKDQALGLYPTKPREIDTSTWAEPYLTTFGNLLETPSPGLFDRTVQSALTTGQSLGDFQKTLRSDTRWQKTQNAEDEYFGTLSELSKVMGY
jgi:hypothetical protein